MIRLNRKVEYALMALKVIVQKGPNELTSAKEIVDKVGSPFDATARVLQQLAQRQILISEHGAHGGYRLLGDLRDVSVFSLIETVLGPVQVAKCLQSAESCDLLHTCNIVSPITSLNQRLRGFYQAVSVADLLEANVVASRETFAEVAP